MEYAVVPLIVINSIFGFAYVLIILMLFGYGGWLLAGFNVAVGRKANKKSADYRFLLRCYALSALLVILFAHVGAILLTFQYFIIGGILVGMTLPICIICTIIFFKNEKIMNAYYNVIKAKRKSNDNDHDDANAKNKHDNEKN